MMERAHQELKLVFVMMKDAVRMGLLKHELQFSTEHLTKATRGDFLKRLAVLVDEALREQSKWPNNQEPTTTSTESLKLNAAGMGVVGNANSKIHSQ
jgi:hypothetical protein